MADPVQAALPPRAGSSIRRLTTRYSSIVTHYWRHAAFLEDDQLLRDAAVLNGVPGVLIHGRYDVSSPLQTAWELHKRWSTTRLVVVDDAGHGGGSLTEHVIGALAEFSGAARLRSRSFDTSG
jgi:pimeloyl-ACP methyl ester carboxylesterase